MDKQHILKLLKKCFDLMLANKLRENMDDTLLEKLLNLIKNAFQNKEFAEDLLNGLPTVQLCEQSLLSLIEKDVKFSTPIKVFALRLVGVIFGKSDIFINYKNSKLMLLLSSTFGNSASCQLVPSVLDATLFCFLSISKHPEGTIWIIEKKLLDFVFLSFSSSSYYVRKTAASFFAEAFSTWTSENFCALLELQYSMVLSTIKDTITRLIDNLQYSVDTPDIHVYESSIVSLTQLLELPAIKVLIVSSPYLIEKTLKCFKNLNKMDVMKENVQNFILSLYSKDPALEPVVFESIDILSKHQLFNIAIHFFSSFLSVSESYKPVTEKHIQFILLPLQILSGIVPMRSDSNDVLLLPSDENFAVLLREMESKSNCVKLVVSSLQSLSKLIKYMDVETINNLLQTVSIAAKAPTSEQNHSMAFICIENRNCCLALLNLFSNILEREVCSRMDRESLLLLFEYLVCFLERPSVDCNILSEALSLMKKFIVLNAKLHVDFSLELKEKLIQLICRKLLDNKEPVIDNALHLAGQIMCGEGKEAWRDAVLRNGVHLIVWQIAVEGTQEGFVKATALKVLIEACSVSFYWEDIKITKKVDEIQIVEILYRYFHSPDFFVQRESVQCLFEWIRRRGEVLPAHCRETLFAVLSQAVQSLDLDLKLTALDIWEGFAEEGQCLDFLPNIDLDAYLSLLCTCGFASSLMFALEDYDESVIFKAAAILLKLQRRLSIKGHSIDSLLHEESPETGILPSDEPNILSDELTSAEEKIVGVESVMKLSTAVQLANICRLVEDDAVCNNFTLLPMETFACSVSSFWSVLWSEKLDSVNSVVCEDRDDIFSEYSVSLLEDVIAAEDTEEFHSPEETRDCY